MYKFECDCGRTFTQDFKQRPWHCGALDCEYLPRRTRQKLFPRQPGRPPQLLVDPNDPSNSVYRRKLTVNLPYFLRDRLEETCTLLRISMARAVQEMVTDWLKDNEEEAMKKITYKKHGGAYVKLQPKKFLVVDGIDV